MQRKVVRAGRHAIAVTVHPHDKFEAGRDGNLDNERAELLEADDLVSRQDVPYEFRFSEFFPASFPIVPTRLVIAQWKQFCPTEYGPCADRNPVLAVLSDRFDANNTTLLWVMYYAFDCGMNRDESNFSGLPGWAKSENFDIVAKVADADVPAWKHLSDAERERMIRDVLADRFKLRTHRQTRERPVYNLVVASGGPKLTQVEIPPPSNSIFYSYSSGGHVALNLKGLEGHYATMDSLANYLTTLHLGREVHNQTGLTGNYDFTLKFTPLPETSSSSDEANAPPVDTDGPFIFTALEKQLGLKLEPARGPVNTIVIDNLERPSEE